MVSKQKKVQFRRLEIADAAAGYRLSQQCGWPHRLEDWQNLLAWGQGFGLEVAGVLHACALAWQWQQNHASIGVVIVENHYQGQGIGRCLLEALLADLPDCRIRLHATAQGAKLYQNMGFIAQGRLHQYQCEKLPRVPRPELPRAAACRLANVDDLPAVLALERQITGCTRPIIYRYLIDNQRLFLLVDQRDQLLALAGCHRYGRGYTVGPVLLVESTLAQPFLQQIFSELPGEFVRIDLHPQALSAGWLEQWQMVSVDDPLIMVYGAQQEELSRAGLALAVMSPALG